MGGTNLIEDENDIHNDCLVVSLGPRGHTHPDYTDATNDDETGAKHSKESRERASGAWRTVGLPLRR